MSGVEAPASATSPGVPPMIPDQVPAPLISEIVADPANLASREDDLVFAFRSPYEDRRADGKCLIVATSEAGALRDYDARLQGVAELHRRFGDAYWVRDAERMREGMHFLGRQEVEVASEAIARHWLHRLDTSPTGELFVGLHTIGSPVFIYNGVKDALDRLNPDAAAEVVPVSLMWNGGTVERVRDRVRRAGMVLLDDWNISGAQIEERVDWLHATGIPREHLEINLLAASTSAAGYRLSGVPCLSYFVYPFMGKLRPSITGAHGDTDYGFRDRLKAIYQVARAEAQGRPALFDPTADHGRLVLPLLYHVARYYRRDHALMMAPSEAAAVYTEQQARYRYTRQGLTSFQELAQQEVGA